MKEILARKPLSIRKSLIHGYGVFADCDIAAGEIIEECHTILSYGGDNLLKDYYFSGGRYHAIPAGFGLVYNHSANPSANYFFDEKSELLIFKARLPIAQGEEILISYGKEWFEKRGMPVKSISLLRRIWRLLTGMSLRMAVACGGIYLLAYLMMERFS